MKLTQTVLAAGIGLCLSATATAEAPADRAANLDRIQVTATRRAEQVLEVPVGVTVVDAEDIARRAPQTVADLLHGEPGTYVQQTTPGQGVVIVRGLKGSEVLHLVDGFRLNNAIFRNAPNQYIALVDPLNVEQIEVARGPMSVLYGSDAMGGVVHFLTPEPRFTGSDWQTDGLVRTRLASADDSNHSRVSVQTGREGLGLMGGVSYQKVGLLRVGGGTELPYTGYTQESGDFKLLTAPAPGHELMFSLQYSRQPKTPRYDALVAGFGQTRPENAEFLFMPQERRFAQLRYRYTNPTAFADNIEVQVGRQQIVDDRTTRETATLNREIEENTSTLLGISAQAGKSLNDAHYLSYGVEFSDDTIASFRQRTNINTGAVTARPSRFPDGSTMKSWGVYVSDDWLLSDRLDINLGARYSSFDIVMPATAATGVGVSLTPDDLTGHIGAAYKLSDGLRLVGNVGRGFRAPNIFDLGTLGSRPGGRYNIPNPNLTPEYVNTFDIGLKYSAGPWQWEAMAFRSNYQDKITSVLTGEKTDTGADIVQSRNATRLTMSGFESGVKYRPSEALEMYISSTYTRGDTVTDNGIEDPADRVPPLFGKLGARFAVTPQWEVEGWAFYASRQDRLSQIDLGDARINPNGTAGWGTFNARVGYLFSDALNLQLTVENLADKRYREHGSGLDEPGRNVSLAVDWKF